MTAVRPGSASVSSSASELRDGLTVMAHGEATAAPTGIVGDAINAIRFLAVDAVERARSGHPGTPMALAPLAYVLFTRHLRHDPTDPAWPDRDRFVLSNGHACMLLYASLHLSGYDLTIEDLKRFRQWGSRTPGHPERGVTPGVEINTGPLGQGVANAVGMAITERMLAARFNRPGQVIVDHRAWAIAGDGDMMEGVSSEAASLAGALGLGKLTVFYDDNHISIEGSTDVAFCEHVAGRFAAYGWHVATVGDVNDFAALERAIAEAKSITERPSLVVVRSHIGFGSPLQDNAKSHGSPLGPENVAATRRRLGWQYAPFEIPAEVYEHWRSYTASGRRARQDWLAAFGRYRSAEPVLAGEFERVLAGRLPAGWRSVLPSFEVGTRLATRQASGVVLNALASVVPELVGGAADLAPSTDTYLLGGGDVSRQHWSARNFHFGVREHAMGALLNGMAAHGGFQVFGATFFAFSDYMRPAIRLAALMRLPVTFVFTHDSIGLGEDGPTHQPIEHLASLRAMPGLLVIRPADAHETAQAWAIALEHDGPTLIVLSRQTLPVLDPAPLDVAAGASVIAPGESAAIVGTGSEVEVALAARELLAAEGIGVRVVSMPSWELFRRRTPAERAGVLPAGMPSVAVEAAAPLGWSEFVDAVVGLERYGASAPATVLYAELGITPEAVARKVRSLLSRR